MISLEKMLLYSGTIRDIENFFSSFFYASYLSSLSIVSFFFHDDILCGQSSWNWTWQCIQDASEYPSSFLGDFPGVVFNLVVVRRSSGWVGKGRKGEKEGKWRR